MKVCGTHTQSKLTYWDGVKVAENGLRLQMD